MLCFQGKVKTRWALEGTNKTEKGWTEVGKGTTDKDRVRCVKEE